MNHKQIIGAVGFFSLGALVAWAVTADRYHNKIQMAYRIGYASADAAASIKPYKDVILGGREIEDLKVHSFDIHPGPNAFGETIHVVEPETDSDDEPHFPEDETPQETRENLQAIIDKYTANPDDQDEFVRQASRSIGDFRPPYVIPRGEYAYGEDAEGYAKITLTYYPRDRVLLDDDNDPIDDIPGTIGWRALSNFGGESGDPDVVFVRNDRLLSDFEVIKEEDSELPLHVKYGMSEEEFNTNKAAGTLKLRREDE